MHFISLSILILAVLFGFAPAHSFEEYGETVNVSVFDYAFGLNRAVDPTTILIICFVFLFISIILLIIYSIKASFTFLKVASFITTIIATIWMFKTLESKLSLEWGIYIIASLLIGGLLVIMCDLIFDFVYFKERLTSRKISSLFKKQSNNQKEKINKIHNETVNRSHSESTNDSQDKFLKELDELYIKGKISKEFYDKKVEEYKSKS